MTKMVGKAQKISDFGWPLYVTNACLAVLPFHLNRAKEAVQDFSAALSLLETSPGGLEDRTDSGR